MIWWMAALAATPDDLASLVPEAREQLATCEVEGCPPEAGARAAYVLAVDAYVDRGEADGTLAATVQVLDGELFTTLPAVVQAARSTPLSWSVTGTPTDDDDAPVAPTPPTATPAPKRYKPGAVLTVKVVSGEGDAPAVVPHAMVRFPEEGEDHRVNTLAGTWTSTLLYLPDGTERFFDKGETFTMDVFAAGYALQQVTFVVPRRKKHQLTVRLDPVERTAPDGAPTSAHDAIEAHAAWLAAEEAYLAGPSAEREQASWVARRRTAGFARTWLEQGGGSQAWELCVIARSHTYCGEAPR